MVTTMPFAMSHIAQAKQIALKNYLTERSFVSALPHIDATLDLTPFAKNGLGIAAFENAQMVGFLCCVSPFPNAFRSTDAVGVFSPMGASGAVGENRAEIYGRLYQAAADLWVKAGAASHGIFLYAHDKQVEQQFFRYGFGMRTVDGIRGMKAVPVTPCQGYEFVEIRGADITKILPLHVLLDAHLAESPCFMRRPPDTEKAYLQKAEETSARFFAAIWDNEIVAYLTAAKGGETFIRDIPGYLHINEAFCLPAHRGKGILGNLLALLVETLRAEGTIQHLGVDFESINPTAYSFWNKHFAAYTNGVVRRIDEHVIKKQ